MLNFTACALTGSPFWNLTPLRILNSHVRSSTRPPRLREAADELHALGIAGDQVVEHVHQHHVVDGAGRLMRIERLPIRVERGDELTARLRRRRALAPSRVTATAATIVHAVRLPSRFMIVLPRLTCDVVAKAWARAARSGASSLPFAECSHLTLFEDDMDRMGAFPSPSLGPTPLTSSSF